MYTVYNYAKKSGRLGEMDSIPYQGRERSCNYKSKKNGLIAFKISGYTDARGEAAHVRALDSSGPLSVAYTCTKKFFKYTGGIYRDSSRCSGGGHAVTSVGYAPTYFIMKNSWGKTFGEKGYFRIARGNVCGINNHGYIPTLVATGKVDDGTDEGGDDGGDDDDSTCSDSNARCPEWAGRSPSECTENWTWMKDNCAKSCGVCGCQDNSPKCAEWKGKGYCTQDYVSFMDLNCKKTCGNCSDDGGDTDGCQAGFKKCPDGSCVHEHWNCDA